MPKLATQKTDTTFRNAKPKASPYLIADGNGLYLKVTADGVKRWIFRYTFQASKKTIALPNNRYPGMSAKTARDIVQNFQDRLSHEEDPATARKAAKAEKVRAEQDVRNEALKNAATFKVMAEEWMKVKLSHRSASTRIGVRQRFERNIYPLIGDRPISEIKPPDLLEVVRRIEAKGKLETAHRCLGACGKVFRYAIAKECAERDIAADIKDALTPAQAGHRAAITDPEKFGLLLREIDSYQGWYATKYALRILPLVFTRPGELRLAQWSEIDFKRAQWDIPAGRMKMRIPHTVPLSRQVLELLEELQPLSGQGPFLSPTPRQKDKPISNVAILNALRRMGYGTDEQCAHGFRASARTILDERLRVNPIFIEAQLAHKVSDALGTAYNRTLHLDARKEMMQQWADYLDTLKLGDASATAER